MPGIGVPALAARPPGVRRDAGIATNSDFDDFKGDIEAAERRVAREIDPGARALVIAICVFVLLATFVLPHTGGARGLDVLVGYGCRDPQRDRVAVAGVRLVRTGVRCRFLDAGAADPSVGAGVDRAGRVDGGVVRSGLLAVWSRQTAADAAPRPRYRAGPGVDRRDRADLQLGPRGVGPHRAAAGRRGTTPPASPPNADARACSTVSATTTGRPGRRQS